MRLNDGIRDLVTEDPADKWGDALATHFAIGDVLYSANEFIPLGWQYRASPMFDDDVEDVAENANGNYGYATETLAEMYVQNEITADDLRYAGGVLSRYLGILRLAGLDY